MLYHRPGPLNLNLGIWRGHNNRSRARDVITAYYLRAGPAALQDTRARDPVGPLRIRGPGTAAGRRGLRIYTRVDYEIVLKIVPVSGRIRVFWGLLYKHTNIRGFYENHIMV
jgi:hypothetical protein